MPGIFSLPDRSVGTPADMVVPDPAVAAQWVVTVPANEIWKVQTITFDINAGVGTRKNNVLFRAGGAVKWMTTHSTGLARPHTTCFGIGHGSVAVLYNSRHVWRLPNVYVSNGTLESFTNIAAGDQLTLIYITYRYWTIV